MVGLAIPQVEGVGVVLEQPPKISTKTIINLPTSFSITRSIAHEATMLARRADAGRHTMPILSSCHQNYYFAGTTTVAAATGLTAATVATTTAGS
jgi:hypothetical protein